MSPDKLAILHLTAANDNLRAANLCMKEALDKILDTPLDTSCGVRDLLEAQIKAAHGLGAASVLEVSTQ